MKSRRITAADSLSILSSMSSNLIPSDFISDRAVTLVNRSSCKKTGTLSERRKFSAILLASTAAGPSVPFKFNGKPMTSARASYVSMILVTQRSKSFQLRRSMKSSGVVVMCSSSETATPTRFVPKSIPSSRPERSSFLRKASVIFVSERLKMTDSQSQNSNGVLLAPDLGRGYDTSVWLKP